LVVLEVVAEVKRVDAELAATVPNGQRATFDLR